MYRICFCLLIIYLMSENVDISINFRFWGRKMRVIMSGGGTGGHIYPALAIADEIKRRHPDAEILFVGTERGMEKRIVPANGYPIRFITVSGFNRRNMMKNVKTARDLLKGMREAKAIMKEFRPDVVIGTGGYVCGPVVRSAYKMGIPCYIHEQNAFPGMTNKLLSKHVDRIFLAFEEAGSYFKVKKAPVVTGNPVRHAFAEVTEAEAREQLGISPDDFVILGFGGSLGARCINNVMLEVAERFAGKPGVKIIFATGRSYYESLMKGDHPEADNLTYLEYINDMPLYLNACDVAVTRSGALTVSEITAAGKASVMIPSPNVTGNHQYFNAKVVADRGGSELIEEKNLSDGQVADLLEKLEGESALLESMAKASSSLGRMDASEVICDTIGI